VRAQVGEQGRHELDVRARRPLAFDLLIFLFGTAVRHTHGPGQLPPRETQYSVPHPGPDRFANGMARAGQERAKPVAQLGRDEDRVGPAKHGLAEGVGKEREAVDVGQGGAVGLGGGDDADGRAGRGGRTHPGLGGGGRRCGKKGRRKSGREEGTG